MEKSINSIKKQFEIYEAIKGIEEAMEVVYQHAYYGLPSHLSEEDQKPLDENGCVFKLDQYYDNLHDELRVILQSLEKQLE